MRKAEYLGKTEVEAFVKWLRRVIDGAETINFRPGVATPMWSHLSDAIAGYSWPPKTNNGPKRRQPTWTFPSTPYKADFVLLGRSNLVANNLLLLELQNGLREAFATPGAPLRPWVCAILVWGGVYTERGKITKKGNAGWLRSMEEPQLRNVLTTTRQALLQDNDVLEPLNARL